MIPPPGEKPVRNVWKFPKNCAKITVYRHCTLRAHFPGSSAAAEIEENGPKGREECYSMIKITTDSTFTSTRFTFRLKGMVRALNRQPKDRANSV